MTMRAMLTAVVAAAALGGCSTKCTGVGLVRIVPLEATILVGQTTSAELQEGSSCGGPAAVDASYRTVHATWSTPDSGVVTIDTLTGKVTARAVGDARVHPQYGEMFTFMVHVR